MKRLHRYDGYLYHASHENMNGQCQFSVGHSATMLSKATSSTQGYKHRENAAIKADSSLVTNKYKDTKTWFTKPSMSILYYPQLKPRPSIGATQL